MRLSAHLYLLCTFICMYHDYIIHTFECMSIHLNKCVL
nr:MAG TPA: hypothetical protein [Inoviridae sp.]